jgi:hypothetical protein
MDPSWAVWIFAFLLFMIMMRVLESVPGGRRSWVVVAGLGVSALGAGVVLPIVRWHLLWMMPLALLAAYLFTVRQLMFLMKQNQAVRDIGPRADPAGASSRSR